MLYLGQGPVVCEGVCRQVVAEDSRHVIEDPA